MAANCIADDIKANRHKHHKHNKHTHISCFPALAGRSIWPASHVYCQPTQAFSSHSPNFTHTTSTTETSRTGESWDTPTYILCASRFPAQYIWPSLGHAERTIKLLHFQPDWTTYYTSDYHFPPPSDHGTIHLFWDLTGLAWPHLLFERELSKNLHFTYQPNIKVVCSLENDNIQLKTICWLLSNMI